MVDEFKEKRERLVKRLIEDGHLKSPEVIKAFREIPRHLFVMQKHRGSAYIDEPLPIGFSQTISAPSMVAMMLELLELRPGDKVLEVGAGSGWNCSLVAAIVGKTGFVWTIELDENLVKFARANAKKAGIKNLKIMKGDGSKGWPKEAPFDKVVVTCAAPSIPKALVEQLKEGGKLIVPVGGGWAQDLILGIKKKGKLDTSSYGGCVFVPLRH